MAKCLLLACVLVAVPIAAAAQAAAPQSTAIERLIAEQRPCQAVSTESAGITIGINELEEVTLRTATATLDGDNASLSFTGRLACRTPGTVAIPGNAAATITAEASMSLADCSIGRLSVDLHEFGGTLAPAIELLSPALEEQIADAARPDLIEACRQFAGREDEAVTATPAARAGDPGVPPRPRSAPDR